MTVILKKIKDTFYYYDPTKEFLFKSFMATAVIVTSVLFWMYTHKPCTCIIVMAPTFMFSSTLTVNAYKEKINRMLLFFLYSL